MNRYLIFLILLLSFFSVAAISANENVTLDNQTLFQSGDELSVVYEVQSTVNESFEPSDAKQSTKIVAKDVKTYYKDNFQLIGYLKDCNNQPISNKKVSVSINDKNYYKITDNVGKVVLKLNLKPGTYTASFKFLGDDGYAASATKAMVKVDKATLSINAKNYRTYFESGFYFKAKVTNKMTKNPVKGIKVSFKVYSNHKSKTYYATTDDNGIAVLKKNLKVGSYKVAVSIKNKNAISKKKKVKLTIKQTEEFGCSSLYVQVSGTESVVGFRRDTTNARALHIVKYKLNGKTAVKQYKKNSYFFHIIATCDGWMAGTGGVDNPTINHAIEKIVGKMVKEGKIKKSYLKKIRSYERRLGIGHFSIKAPNGKYALVWARGILTGKLKSGEYLCAPNKMSMFKHGKWAKFSKDPAKAAIKIAAKDSFGINRRDVTAFHWKATTKLGKTNSTLKVYAANDNGKLVGRHTGYLKDNIYFKGKFISKNKLPSTPSSKFLGTHKLGNIDKLIKTYTTVKAPNLIKSVNETGTLNITVKNKKTGKVIKNLKLKIKIGNKTYSVTTNSKGVAKFNPESLDVGEYNVTIYTNSIKYKVSAKSTIAIA